MEGGGGGRSTVVVVDPVFSGGNMPSDIVRIKGAVPHLHWIVRIERGGGAGSGRTKGKIVSKRVRGNGRCHSRLPSVRGVCCAW